MKFKSELLNDHVKRKNIYIRNGYIALQPYDTDLRDEEVSILKALREEDLKPDTTILLHNYTADGLRETNKLLLDNAIIIITP